MEIVGLLNKEYLVSGVCFLWLHGLFVRLYYMFNKILLGTDCKNTFFMPKVIIVVL